MHTFFKKIKRANLVILSLFYISACGGGDGSDSAPPPTPVNIAPTVTVEANLTSINEGQDSTLTITASDSDGTIVASQCTWSADSSALSLSSDTGSSIVVTGQNVNADTTVTITATCTDDDNAQGSGSVNITIIDLNQAPTVDAGSDQAVAIGSLVTLAGSCSDPDGDATTAMWEQASGGSVTLSDSSALDVTFTTGSTNDTLEFTLTCTDSGTKTGVDTVTITVDDSTYNADIKSVEALLGMSDRRGSSRDIIEQAVALSGQLAETYFLCKYSTMTEVIPCTETFDLTPAGDVINYAGGLNPTFEFGIYKEPHTTDCGGSATKDCVYLVRKALNRVDILFQEKMQGTDFLIGRGYYAINGPVENGIKVFDPYGVIGLCPKGTRKALSDGFIECTESNYTHTLSDGSQIENTSIFSSINSSGNIFEQFIAFPNQGVTHTRNP